MPRRITGRAEIESYKRQFFNFIKLETMVTESHRETIGSFLKNRRFLKRRTPPEFHMILIRIVCSLHSKIIF